jgi:hypothetical protein
LIDLLACLDQVRGAGDGWTARCPAHEHRRSSLSITQGDDEPWLVKCHAGCPVEHIVAPLGLTTKGMFPATRANGRKQIVATYDYQDEDGKLLYSVCRFEPKDFRPKRADGRWTVKTRGTCSTHNHAHSGNAEPSVPSATKTRAR